MKKIIALFAAISFLLCVPQSTSAVHSESKALLTMQCIITFQTDNRKPPVSIDQCEITGLEPIKD